MNHDQILDTIVSFVMLTFGLLVISSLFYVTVSVIGA